MISKVQMTRLAQGQLGEYVGYIKRKFKNPQAAKAVTTEARETRKALLNVADCVYSTASALSLLPPVATLTAYYPGQTE